MLKGTHKQMVVLHTHGSAYYEQAYFVLREGRQREEGAERTMLEEANRILDECCLLPAKHRCRTFGRRACFWLGALVGSAVCGLLWLLIAVL